MSVKLPSLKTERNKENRHKSDGAVPQFRPIVRKALRRLESNNQKLELLPSKIHISRQVQAEVQPPASHVLVPKVVPHSASDAKFVDASEYFRKLDELRAINARERGGRADSGAELVPVPVPVARMLEREVICKKKRTLLQKLTNRRSGRCEIWGREESIYEMAYFTDNLKCLLETESRFVFRVQMLKILIDFDQRMITINWLVWAQQKLNLSESSLFSAIRFFDHYCIISKESSSKYPLIALASLWIASKFIDSRTVLIPKLIVLLENTKSKCEIFDMERKILEAIKFDVNIPNPALFLNYYLKDLQLESNLTVYYLAMYILELMTVLKQYSAIFPSMLAASALYWSLDLNKLQTEPYLRYVEKTLPYSSDSFMSNCKDLRLYLRRIRDYKRFFPEIELKYASSERFKVNTLLTD